MTISLPTTRWPRARCPTFYIGGVAEAAKGAWPSALPGSYDADTDEIAAYARAAKTTDGFQDYLARTLGDVHSDAAE